MSGHPLAVGGSQAEGDVVVGQRALLDLQFQLGRLVASDPKPLPAQPLGRVQMGRVGQGLVARPAAHVIGDQQALAVDLHPLQIGAKLRPGRNDVSRNPLARSTSPFASGSAGRQIRTLAPSTPRNAWQAAVSSLRPRRHRPTAPSPSHTSTRWTAPSPSSSCHQPPKRSSVPRVGSSSAPSQRAYPVTPTSTGSWVGVRTCPHPTGTSMSGNHRSNWAISPAAYAVRDAGSGGKYAGRSSRTRSLSTVNDRSQPIRSAITVAGICGQATSNSRMRGSTPSTTDPCGARTYVGGPWLASARLTVFLEIPITRAIALIGICSARYNRRISAQSSTFSTPLPPGSTFSSQGLDRERGQLSAAAKGSVFTRRRHHRRP